MMRTYGGTPSDVIVRDDNGLPAVNVGLTVWTAKNGTQITELEDLDGQSLPGYVPSDTNGQFSFRIKSNSWPIVWVRDPSGNWYYCVAQEIMADAASAGEQFPAMQTQFADMKTLIDRVEATINIPAGLIADTGTQAAATANIQIINAALQLGSVKLPAGKFWINDSIRIPSYRCLTGAGAEQTLIEVVDGVDEKVPAITNQGNDLTAHTNPDVWIYLADLSVDRNFTNRTGSGKYENGCAVRFSCVEHALVERVHARNGKHSFDISASIYRNDGLTAYAPGPSRWVTLRDCIGGASNDDVFTTHHSQFLRLENCVAIQDSDDWTADSHGFEIDDGSLDVQVVGCYSYGFDEGFQVKSHPTAPPARRVALVDCVADHTRIGFDLQSTTDSGAVLPDDYVINADVRVIRCTATNIQVTQGASTQQKCSLRVIGYHNVRIEDFVCRDSPSGYMSLQSGAGEIVVDGMVSENSWTSPSWSTPTGIIHIQKDAGNNIVLRNVEARATVLPAPIITVEGPGDGYMISDIRGTVDGNNPAVRLTSWKDSWSVSDINADAVTADIQITAGTRQGTYARQMTPRDIQGTAAPTTGTWNVGDRCWNQAPAAAQILGWVCTTAGTPGTWVAMGNAAAA